MLHKNLRVAREHAGLTRDEVTMKTGITLAALSQYETGARSPSASLLVDLVNMYGCSMDAVCETDFYKRKKMEKTM